VSLTADPFIESARAERDVETPTFHPEVDTLGAFVIEDAEGPYAAEHVRTGTWECFCTDGRHRDLDRRELAYADSWIKGGAHRVPVHIYAVVGPVIEEKDA
jgi:hypothetical protein